MRRLLTTALTALLVAAACSSDDPTTVEAGAAQTEEAQLAEGPPRVTPGRANWSTGYFQAAVYAALLEELGYDVADPADNEYPPAEAYAEMAEGTFDFWANGWYSQHFTWHEEVLSDGSAVGDHVEVVGAQLPAGGLEGLVITKSVADEHGIRSLAQVNDDPELVALFDGDGNGRAEIFGCPDDWTCDDIIDELIAFNDWSNLEQVEAGYPGLIAATIDRVQAGQPAIQYTWSPSSYLTELIPGETVVWLSLGGSDHVLDGSTPGGFDFSQAPAAPLGGSCSDDPCWIGWEVADVLVTANGDFLAANPPAAALLDAVELQVTDIAQQNARYEAGEDTEADLQRHAAEWIAEHRALVDEWLATARAAGTVGS